MCLWEIMLDRRGLLPALGRRLDLRGLLPALGRELDRRGLLPALRRRLDLRGLLPALEHGLLPSVIVAIPSPTGVSLHAPLKACAGCWSVGERTTLVEHYRLGVLGAPIVQEHAINVRR